MLGKWVVLALTVCGPLGTGVVASCAAAADRPGDDDGPTNGGRGGAGDDGNLEVDEGGAGGLVSCGATSYEAERLPLDLYFMMDRSGSMGSDNPELPSRWAAVQRSIADFVEQPATAGMGMGMGFFPHVLPNPCYDGQSCSIGGACGPVGANCLPCVLNTCLLNGAPDSCDTSDYATPAVEIAPLPSAAPAIVQAVTDAVLQGGTPTSAALQGALEHATAWGEAHPERIVAVVLTTDGDPTVCDVDPESIGNLATAALESPAHVRTFVIGIGPSLTALNAIALAGGTGEAHLIGLEDVESNELVAALDEVRLGAIACTFAIPTPEYGEVDTGLVNVSYTTQSGKQHVIPQVTGASACPSSEAAWYYDNPADPAQLVLCNGGCTTVRADSKTKVDILVGCKTIVR